MRINQRVISIIEVSFFEGKYEIHKNEDVEHLVIFKISNCRIFDILFLKKYFHIVLGCFFKTGNHILERWLYVRLLQFRWNWKTLHKTSSSVQLYYFIICWTMFCKRYCMITLKCLRLAILNQWLGFIAIGGNCMSFGILNGYICN